MGNPLMAAGSAIGPAISIVSNLRAAKSANQMAKAQAAELHKRANHRRALSQREAQDAATKSALARSRFRALAAAGGGGGDPTTRTVLARIQGEGALNALNLLANGEFRAQSHDFAGDAARFEGKVRYQKAVLDAISDATSFAAKFAQPQPGQAKRTAPPR